MKSKFFAPLLTMGAFLTFLPNEISVSASSGYAGGSGTESDPYLISTPEHLIHFNKDINVNKVDTYKVYYRLTNDIDFSGYDTDTDGGNGNWTPLATEEMPFEGVFDGNGYKILGIQIVLPEQDHVGFFWLY